MKIRLLRQRISQDVVKAFMWLGLPDTLGRQNIGEMEWVSPAWTMEIVFGTSAAPYRLHTISRTSDKH